MNTTHTHQSARHLARLTYAAGLVSLALAMALGLTGRPALAAPLAATAPGLGAAASFSVLGKAGVTNTGNSVLSGNVGADQAITGFPPGSAASLVFAPAVNQAEADATAADLALTAQAGSATPTGPNLTGLTLVPGAYSVGAALLPGQLTLDGPGVYVFLATALTASGSVSLINGASACDVFWHVDSSASLTGGAFVGTIIAGTSITFGDSVSLNGRALALTGNVTLINNNIFGPACAQAVQPGTAAHVSVTHACVDDGRLAVTVGVSAGVTVYGLGEPITSGTDTGENRIVRYLAPGHYEWRATPPAGQYLLDIDHGVIDVAACATGSIAVATQIGAPAVLLPVTGVDQTADRSFAARQWLRIGLVTLGMGLVVVGFTLRRRRAL